MSWGELASPGVHSGFWSPLLQSRAEAVHSGGGRGAHADPLLGLCLLARPTTIPGDDSGADGGAGLKELAPGTSRRRRPDFSRGRVTCDAGEMDTGRPPSSPRCSRRQCNRCETATEIPSLLSTRGPTAARPKGSEPPAQVRVFPSLACGRRGRDMQQGLHHIAAPAAWAAALAVFLCPPPPAAAEAEPAAALYSRGSGSGGRAQHWSAGGTCAGHPAASSTC